MTKRPTRPTLIEYGLDQGQRMSQTPVTPLEVLDLRSRDIAAEADSELGQVKWTSRGYWVIETRTITLTR